MSLRYLSKSLQSLNWRLLLPSSITVGKSPGNVRLREILEALISLAKSGSSLLCPGRYVLEPGHVDHPFLS